MRDTVLDELDKEDYDIIIFAAAPVDYGFAKTSTTKIDSSTELTIRLTPTPKIIADATRKAKTRKPSAVIVGFSAETVKTDQELVERARKKLDKYEVDIIIANNVAKPGIGFASKYNE
ncbi:MAG TPA: bifunctional phosphopantothenoylcysteine decarboxylase/phosphopantothenate--cysteine ligase CoaBC, partial [Desulfurococcaceae archaeon]|nr:bifunctional phosphopantothenoylcysteine decarboxylase/phosphopantothenate--cysteine ligase CoaBC [Desulfurococcaceae archaeon]